jgi:hypothetical protein
MGINGVFLSIIFAFIISNVVMLYFNRNQLRGKFSLFTFKTWIYRF